MLFNSLGFTVFFPIALLGYFILPTLRIKNFWLLVCSYYFYMGWNAKYALLLLTSTVITFLSGLIIERIKGSALDAKTQIRCKKATVFASFALNLGILAYFKYTNFFLDTLGKVFYLLGISLYVPQFDILLPVGISFFTFQALSYTMDVYRDEIYAEKNFFQYALFVSFFPQLVAGPIERSKNLLKQLHTVHPFSASNFREGFLLMLWGFFLKIVLADRMAMVVDTVYSDIYLYPGVYLTVATVLFAFQIYCDFAGYSTIAMGCARVLGIDLLDNFRAPYLSLSVSEFWRNWHISLTSWFKDYLYIPLGGSRKGMVRKQINKMIVFLVSGLWHGASMSFVVWGGLNGLYQVVEEASLPLRNKLISFLGLNRESIGHRCLCSLVTFVLVDISWIFFRAANVSQGFEILASIATVRNPWVLFDGSLTACGLDSANWCVLFLGTALLFFADFCKRRNIQVRKVILQQDYWVRAVVIIAAVVTILIFGVWGPAFDKASFIYFQF